jgi:uracil-DNA glycosylase
MVAHHMVGQASKVVSNDGASGHRLHVTAPKRFAGQQLAEHGSARKHASKRGQIDRIRASKTPVAMIFAKRGFRMQSTLSSFVAVTKKARVGEREMSTAVASAEAPRVEAAAGDEHPLVPPPAEALASPLFELLREPGWRNVLAPEFAKPYFRDLEKAVLAEYASKTVFPPREELFAALNRTPLEAVRVVIIGQDPYHGPKQAMGLSFSVPRGVPVPSSLRNIFKELKSELPGWQEPKHGDLTSWAERGVLLLNTSLTVRQGEANSHAALGWTQLTDRVVQLLSERRQPMVFLLWGMHAQGRAAKMQKNPVHLVLKSAHPSGLSASKGFFGNQHFVKTLDFLKVHGGTDGFDWSLPQ